MPSQILNLLSTGTIQPSVKNRFRISIPNVSSLIQALMTDPLGNDIVTDTDDDVVAYLKSVSNNMQTTPFEVDFRPPSIRVEQRKVRRQNTEIKYGGFLEWGDASLSVNNFTSFHAYRFFYLWSMGAGGLSRDPTVKNRIGQRGSVSRMSINQYKVDITVTQYYGKDDLEEITWLLKGAWPFMVNVESYDNENDGDMHKASIDFSVDAAFPTDTTFRPTD